MDPYKVLGVAHNATDEQVRTAYRELAKKYHPDNYVNNPLADVAAEKMKEVNAAYDQVQSERKTGENVRVEYTAGTHYAAVRNFINYGDLASAERLLNETKPDERDAEWYFLMGSVHYRRGWFDEAGRNFDTAARMDPQNREYAAAQSRMEYQRQSYASGGPTGTRGFSTCDCCSSLICADCCCECMGGDLIPCC
jgi:curved DNA-binding protein CbpA